MKYKKILFLDSEETHYTRGIRNELQLISEDVDCYFYNGIFTEPIFLKLLNPGEYQKQKEKRIKQFLDYIKPNIYDFILVKAPFDFPACFFESLRVIFKNTLIINYNWSSLRKFNFLPYRDYFTKIYSFDREDCMKYNLDYYPLFYLRDFENIGINKRKLFNITFIGSAMSAGRIDFINKFLQRSGDLSLTYFLYLWTPQKLGSARIKFKYPLVSNYCYFRQLPLNEVINVSSASDAMIDHPMAIQTGLTIRTFETLGSGLHLYTTNFKIKEEPFYNSDLITIIDKDLVNFKYTGISERKSDKEWQESFRKYRVDSWVKHITTI